MGGFAAHAVIAYARLAVLVDLADFVGWARGRPPYKSIGKIRKCEGQAQTITAWAGDPPTLRVRAKQNVYSVAGLKN